MVGLVGEVDLGPRWNVNFLRSMRPEPGPGQSGQQGAAILTSNIQYSENMPTTAIFHTIKLSGWERECCTEAQRILYSKIRFGAALSSRNIAICTTRSTMCSILARRQLVKKDTTNIIHEIKLD